MFWTDQYTFIFAKPICGQVGSNMIAGRPFHLTVDEDRCVCCFETSHWALGLYSRRNKISYSQISLNLEVVWFCLSVIQSLWNLTSGLTAVSWSLYHTAKHYIIQHQILAFWFLSEIRWYDVSWIREQIPGMIGPKFDPWHFQMRFLQRQFWYFSLWLNGFLRYRCMANMTVTNQFWQSFSSLRALFIIQYFVHYTPYIS